MNKEVKQDLFSNDYNRECFDCGAENPEWVSVNNAIFLCKECQITHRSFGLSVSYIRSIEMDLWKEEQIHMLRLGGNKRLIDLLQIYNIHKNTPKTDLYFSKLLDYHRRLIKSELKKDQKPIPPADEDALLPFDADKRKNQNVVKSDNVQKQVELNKLNSEVLVDHQDTKPEDSNRSAWDPINSVGKYFEEVVKTGKGYVEKVSESETASKLKSTSAYAYDQVKDKGGYAYEKVRETSGVVLEKSKNIASKGFDYSKDKIELYVIFNYLENLWGEGSREEHGLRY